MEKIINNNIAEDSDIKMEKNENVFKNALTKLYWYNYNINIQ